MPPILPMLAKPVGGIPAQQCYEPKWDGFRTIIFRDDEEVELGSRNTKPMTRYFPEVVQTVLANFPERAVIDGEIIVADVDGNRLDFEVLQQRIHPAASRVKLLSEQTPASFVAFDVLALGDEDLTERPFAERRAMLEQALAPAKPPVHVTPLTRDLETARRWFAEFEGAQSQTQADGGLRGRRLPAAQDRGRRDRLTPARPLQRPGCVGVGRGDRLIPDGHPPRPAQGDAAARHHVRSAPVELGRAPQRRTHSAQE